MAEIVDHKQLRNIWESILRRSKQLKLKKTCFWETYKDQCDKAGHQFYTQAMTNSANFSRPQKNRFWFVA